MYIDFSTDKDTLQLSRVQLHDLPLLTLQLEIERESGVLFSSPASILRFEVVLYPTKGKDLIMKEKSLLFSLHPSFYNSSPFCCLLSVTSRCTRSYLLPESISVTPSQTFQSKLYLGGELKSERKEREFVFCSRDIERTEDVFFFLQVQCIE